MPSSQGFHTMGSVGVKPHTQACCCAGHIPVPAFCKLCRDVGISRSSWLLVDTSAEAWWI